MINEKNAANAIGGNTARACDSCLVKRARWFCGADDAFLCKKCDASVHSANQLASRHERVRLQASSFKANNEAVPAKDVHESPPAWHRGFTRKARTPRHNNNNNKAGFMSKKVGFNPPLPFVPEIGCEEASFMDDDENEDLEQLLYRVPIYDPFAAELCNNMSCDAMNLDDEVTEIKVGADDKSNNDHELDNSQGFLPSDMELAEFAADVETLLGGGLDEDSGDMKGVLGLLVDSKLEEEDGGADVCVNNYGVYNEEARRQVKVEEELLAEGTEFNPSMLGWSLDYDHNHHDSSSPPILFGGEEVEQEEENKVVFLMGAQSGDEVAFIENKQVMMMKRKKICLRLNYEAVMTAWSHQGGSPWTTGTRPELNPSGDSWLDCMGMWPSQVHQPHGDGGGFGAGRGDDRGREARVSRYREKRRTRLFSKKIRYEVRKLNAEKRPRMKGRFVKRTSSSSSNFVGSNSNRKNAAAATGSFSYLISK